MTTEQILDQELDNIEKMMASIRKMLEWPEEEQANVKTTPT
jgi:hypothetical protein